MCESEQPSNWGLCYGFILGVMQRDTLAGAKPTPSRYICKPQSISNGQMVDTVVAYLKDNPEKLAYHAVTVTVIALMRAFPCHAGDDAGGDTIPLVRRP